MERLGAHLANDLLAAALDPKVSGVGWTVSGVEETVRYTYRLRPGTQTERALLEEWHRCRFLWNEAVHQHKTGRKPTFGKLSKLLTEARARSPWLRAGSQVAQQQTLRTYAAALNDSYRVKGRGTPRFKARKKARPSLEYTTRGFSVREGRLRLPGGVSIPVDKKSARQNSHTARMWARRVVADHQVIAVEDFPPRFLARSSMARKAADAAIGAAKRELIERGTRAGRRVVLVSPAYTTMTCASCFARAKQRLALVERVFRCARCGHTAERDRNAARVILAMAEPGHVGADDVRHCSPPSGLVVRSEPEIPRL